MSQKYISSRVNWGGLYVTGLSAGVGGFIGGIAAEVALNKSRQ